MNPPIAHSTMANAIERRDHLFRAIVQSSKEFYGVQ